MAQSAPTSPPSKLVRDVRTGRMLEVRGAGALKGKLSLQNGVDLTKPIFEQASKTKGKVAASSPKR